MYENPVTQQNLARLKELRLFPGGTGRKGTLACGVARERAGWRKLELILARAEELLVRDKPLQGKKVYW
jgi:phosphopantothenoylcysteine synthetase/decarboxylase